MFRSITILTTCLLMACSFLAPAVVSLVEKEVDQMVLMDIGDEESQHESNEVVVEKDFYPMSWTNFALLPDNEQYKERIQNRKGGVSYILEIPSPPPEV